MSDNGDAEVFQVLHGQIGQDRLVYLILAECRLILPEAKPPQPDHDVHERAPNSGLSHHGPTLSACRVARSNRK